MLLLLKIVLPGNDAKAVLGPGGLSNFNHFLLLHSEIFGRNSRVSTNVNVFEITLINSNNMTNIFFLNFYAVFYARLS